MKIEQYKNEPFYNKLVNLKEYAEKFKLDIDIVTEHRSPVGYMIIFGVKDYDTYENFTFNELQEIMKILEVQNACFSIQRDRNDGRRIAIRMR